MVNVPKRAKGEQNGNSKLSREAVAVIRSSHMPYSKDSGGDALAKKFGVSRVTINSIVHGKTWK